MPPSPPLGRREFIADSLLAGAGASVALVGAGARGQGTLQPMSLQLGWALGVTQMGEIVARRRGFYAQEGLALTLQPGGPNFDGVALVGAGRAELGQTSSSPSLMLAASQGIPIRCFAVGAQRHPYTFFSLPSRPVRTPQDMRGKRISMNPTGMVLLRALLAHHGMSERDVRVVPSGAGMGLLLTGQADVATGWATNTGAIRELGRDVVQMSLWDAGIRLYALPYYAAVQTLETHASELERFLRATARGWQYVNEHRDEAIDIAVSEYPHLDRAEERTALDRMLEYSLGGRARTEGWGAMDPVFWQQQIDLYASLGQFTARKPSVQDLMTLAPLNATRAARLRAV